MHLHNEHVSLGHVRPCSVRHCSRDCMLSDSCLASVHTFLVFSFVGSCFDACVCCVIMTASGQRASAQCGSGNIFMQLNSDLFIQLLRPTHLPGHPARPPPPPSLLHLHAHAVSGPGSSLLDLWFGLLTHVAFSVLQVSHDATLLSHACIFSESWISRARRTAACVSLVHHRYRTT
ncbi:TPA: hypothetical protein ACH3X2_011165 [Trebouxia sp. C0005]